MGMRRSLPTLIVFLLLTSGIAAAQEPDSGDFATTELAEEEMMLSFSYDPAQFRLFYRLGVSGEALCTDGDIAEECEAIDVVGPNGQINHGTIVSAFSKSLPPGKGRGCLVRQIAKSGFGKGDQKVGAESDGAGEEAEAVDDPDATIADSEKIDYKAFCQMKRERTNAKGKKAEGFIPPGQAKKQSADGEGTVDD